MGFRSIALIAALGLAGAHGAEQWEQNAIDSVHSIFDAAASSPLFKDNGIQLPRRRARRDGDDVSAADGPCDPDMASTLGAIFPGGSAGFQSWADQCQSFFGTFSDVFQNPGDADSVCTDQCLPSTMRVFSAFASGIPNTDECASQRRIYAGLPAMLQSVLCSRNHLGIRCGAVFGSFAAERSNAASAAGAGGSAITGGAAPASIYGYSIPSNNASLYDGMCGSFDVAGCCMKTSVSSLFGFLSEADTDAATIVTSLDSSLDTIKNTCQAANRAYTNIGADACPLATTRNGNIASGSSIAGGPVAAAVRRRLRLVFNGELSTISATQQEVIKTYIKNKVEAALRADTVESVGLSSGSVVATVSMTADVSPEEVSGLAADASIINMEPPADDSGGTLTQSATPSTEDESTSSSAASVVSGVLATAAAATVIFVL